MLNYMKLNVFVRVSVDMIMIRVKSKLTNLPSKQAWI
jgi:hypothetical protein